MAHREYTNTKPVVASTNTSGNKVRAEANKLIRDNEFEFHEHDIFEVENILLSKMLIRKNFGGEFEEKYYGGIYGYYVHDSRQKTLPMGKTPKSPVLPLDPNIKRYPVPGEYVICINPKLQQETLNYIANSIYGIQRKFLDFDIYEDINSRICKQYTKF